MALVEFQFCREYRGKRREEGTGRDGRGWILTFFLMRFCAREFVAPQFPVTSGAPFMVSYVHQCFPSCFLDGMLP